MDRNKFNKCLSSTELLDIDINYGEAGSVAIDQTPGAPANINPRTGFPYSDMQKIMLQNDLSERRRLLDNMQAYKDDFLPNDISDEDAIAYMVGSNMQLPSEFMEQVELFTSDQLKKVAEKRALKEKMEFFDSMNPKDDKNG